MENLNDTMENIKNPFSIYVLWHPDYNNGSKYAEIIYEQFSREINDYAGESLGIPVYFVTDLNFDYIQAVERSEYVAFVILVDNKILINNDWKNAISNLLNLVNGKTKAKIYPIAISDGAYEFQKLSKINYLRPKKDCTINNLEEEI